VDEIEKILIIRFSSIGDIILTTPLIRALRHAYPRAVIDFAVKEQYFELLKTNPYIDNVLLFTARSGFRGLRAFKRSVQRGKYSLLIDVHTSIRSMYLRIGSGAARTLVYRKNRFRRFILVRFGINLFRDPEPVYRRYFRAVAPLGIAPDNGGTELHVPRDAHARALAELKACGLQPDKMLVTLCPGAGYSTKRWHPEGFAAVSDHCAKKYGAQIVLLGSEQDRRVCETVRKAMFARAAVLCGMLSLLESAGVLRMSALAITNDTGLMHIAQTQRRPVVAIFGPTVREFGFYPFPEKSFVIEKDLPCRPCSPNGSDRCPRKHFRCMKDIAAGEVIRAAEQLLSSESFSPENDRGKDVVSSL